MSCKKHVDIGKPVMNYLTLSETLCYLLVGVSLVFFDRGNASFISITFASVTVLSLFQRPRNLLWMIILMSPFSSMFRMQDSLTILPTMVLIYLAKILLLGKLRIQKTVFLLFGSTLMISMIVAVQRYGSLVSVFSFFAMLLFAFIAVNEESTNLDLIGGRGEFLFVLSVIAYCIFTELFKNAATTLSKSTIYAYRNAGFSNVWEFGRIIVIALAILVVNLRREMTIKRLIISGLFAVFFLYYLITTGLYSALAGFVIVLAMIPFTVEGSIKKKMMTALALSILMVVVFVVGYYYVFLPMLTLRGQFSDNNRVDVWKYYISVFFSNTSIMLFGVGGGCITDFARALNMLTAHNIAVEKFIEFGLVGMVLLFAMVIKQYKRFEFRIDQNYSILILIAFLGTCFTQGSTGSELLFLTMILASREKKALQSNGMTLSDVAALGLQV